MTKLSVNINKVATLRNARGGRVPDVVRFGVDCESFGAQGITVHPRPDERHIRYADVFELKSRIGVEFNIEGNPRGRSNTPPYEFIDLVKQVHPAQVTLVPDAEQALTSNAGWDTIQNADYLRSVVSEMKGCGIRVSIFVDPIPQMVEGAASVGADRVELYTEAFASGYSAAGYDRHAQLSSIRPYVEAAEVARQCGLGLNAGHDLSLENLRFFHEQIPWVDEVSIGHALISDALYLGIEHTIHCYLRCLE